MKTKIIQIGKNKDKATEEMMNEFLRRLGAFAEVKIVTLKENHVSKTFTKDRVIDSEGQEILKEVGEKNPGEFIIVLDEKGELLSSSGLAKLIQSKKNEGLRLVFIIGGPFGLSDDVREMADLVLSFSKMTFTHQMIRVLLLEQLYRAFCIGSGKTYHY